MNKKEQEETLRQNGMRAAINKMLEYGLSPTEITKEYYKNFYLDKDSVKKSFNKLLSILSYDCEGGYSSAYIERAFARELDKLFGEQ